MIYLEGGTIVANVDGLLNCKVTPVGDLILLHHLGNSEEGSIVLVVNPERSVGERLDIRVSTIGEGISIDLVGGGGFTVALNMRGGKLDSGTLGVGVVGGEEVCIVIKAYKLMLGHGDLSGIGLERCNVGEENLESDCLSCINGELYSV